MPDLSSTDLLPEATMPTIDHRDDPRLALYVGIKDRDIRRETGLFLAEGEHLVRRAIEAGLTVRSVLVIEQKKARVEDMLAHAGAEGVEVLSCSRAVLDSSVGFAMHQGIIAAVEPAVHPATLDAIDRSVTGEAERAGATLLVCPEITNVENLGLLTRVAAGLGIAAMVLGPQCADPWYRRSVRVSMGAVFRIPMIRLDDLGVGLDQLQDQLGYQLVATVTDSDATPIREMKVNTEHKHAILLGSEGYGLPIDVVKRCDQKVRVPMHAEVDSLNVAVAAGIVIHHFCRTH